MTTADICDANTFATPPAGGKFQILQFAAKLSDNWHAAGEMKSWNTDEYFKEFPNFKLWPKSLNKTNFYRVELYCVNLRDK